MWALEKVFEILIVKSASAVRCWALLGTKGVNQQQSHEQDRSAPARRSAEGYDGVQSCTMPCREQERLRGARSKPSCSFPPPGVFSQGLPSCQRSYRSVQKLSVTLWICSYSCILHPWFLRKTLWQGWELFYYVEFDTRSKLWEIIIKSHQLHRVTFKVCTQ